MPLDWLFDLKRARAARRARERIESKLRANRAILERCRTDLHAMNGLEPDAERLAIRLTREIDKRAHAIRCLEAELAALPA